MLRIIDSRECSKTEVEFGDYLPFKFWHDAKSVGPNYYWRTGDLVTTLLEVEIDRGTGQIVAVSLLLPGRVSRAFPEIDFAGVIRANGYPSVDTSSWPSDRVRDEAGMLRVFIDSSRLLILLSASVAVSKICLADNVTFGVDVYGSIDWILVSNLPEQKLIDIENL